MLLYANVLRITSCSNPEASHTTSLVVGERRCVVWKAGVGWKTCSQNERTVNR